MSRILITVLSALLAILYFGCDQSQPVKPGDTITLDPEAGAFGLGYMQGLRKALASDTNNMQRGADVSFNLGSIKGSSTFYFLLYNVGGRPITDVSLQIADSNFAVFPTNIDTVFPDRTVDLLPIIKVSAYHGTPLEGVGYRPLMPMGNNLCSLVVSGTTKTNNGNDTSVSLKANLMVNALLMDAVFRNDGKIIDLKKPLGGGATGNNVLFDYLNLNNFSMYQATRCISITNTGNVPLDLRALFANEDWINIYDTLDLHIGIGKTINILRDEFNNNAQHIFIRLNSKNTISDLTRFPLQNDGNYYCMFGVDTFTVNFNSPLYAFVIQAKRAQCADKLNNLFLIDSNLVFWDTKGTCSDTISQCTLYKAGTIDSVLCRNIETAAGSHNEYIDSSYINLFDIVCANRLEPDLGLGPDHRAAKLLFKHALERINLLRPQIDEFVSSIKNKPCSDIRNSVFLIDSSLIFWDREGSCSDSTADYSLDTISLPDPHCCQWTIVTNYGSSKIYDDPPYRAMFDTICTNKLKPDLGLGPTHKVDRIHYDGDPNP